MSYYAMSLGRVSRAARNSVCLTDPVYCGLGAVSALGAKFSYGEPSEESCAAQRMLYDENTDSCYTEVQEGESLWHRPDSDCGAEARWDVATGRCVGTGGGQRRTFVRGGHGRGRLASRGGPLAAPALTAQ